MLAEILRELKPSERARIQNCLDLWETSAEPGQRWAREHLHLERVMNRGAFKSLLMEFARKLGAKGVNPTEAYVEACRGHQFHGRLLRGKRPTIVGRAIELNQYAKIVHRASSDAGEMLTLSDIVSEIQKACQRGSLGSGRKQRFHRASIGRWPVIFATFTPGKRAGSPYDEMPDRSSGAIRTAFGLGHYKDTDQLILLSYAPKEQGRHVELHCPTVAEAELNEFFRSVPDLSEEHGWTRPLEPNPKGLRRQPEVVHRKITGGTLVFPFYLAQ